MEALDLHFSMEDLRRLLELLEIEFQEGKELRGETPEETIRMLWSTSGSASEYWAALCVKLEDIPKHLTSDGLNKTTRRVLQWRLEIGK